MMTAAMQRERQDCCRNPGTASRENRLTPINTARFKYGAQSFGVFQDAVV